MKPIAIQLSKTHWAEVEPMSIVSHAYSGLKQSPAQKRSRLWEKKRAMELLAAVHFLMSDHSIDEVTDMVRKSDELYSAFLAELGKE